MKQTIRLPSSKSISNRLLILQKTSGIPFAISNLSTAEDTRLLSDLLQEIARHNGERTTILNCENCGTAYRFLTAFLACKSGEWILDGSERMRERPIKGLVDALKNAGADIFHLKKDGFPSLKINGKSLNINFLQVDSTQSSQYVSALAMILPLMKKDVRLQFSNGAASLQYIDMTLALMQDLGLDIARNENLISYHHTEIVTNTSKNFISYQCGLDPQSPTYNAFNTGIAGQARNDECVFKNPIDFFVEYDWSAAAVWFLLAGLILKGTIFIEGLQKSKYQADAIIADWVKPFGLEMEYQKNGVLLKKTESPIPESFTADCKNNLDLVPYIATLCAALGVNACLQNIENLTFKESNRSEVLQMELSKIANIIRKENSFIIQPNNKQLPDSVCFLSHGDHRIAMSLSVLSALIPHVQIDDMECVKKSYPGFLESLHIITK